MSREFSDGFANRLGVATVQYACEIEECNKASDSFTGEMRAIEDQFRQIMGQCIQTCRTFECLMANGKIEEFEKYIEHHKELQAINELEQDIIAEEFSKFNRNAELYRTFLESVRRMERRKKALLKWRDVLAKIKLAMKVIKALNTMADEEVSVQRIQTEKASDGGSTTIEVAKRKISSERVDDEGSSTAGTMEKVEEFSTDGKLTTSEKQCSEILPGQSSEEQPCEVKQSSSEIDQSSIADRIEAGQELSAAAGGSNNEAIEVQKSTAIGADRTRQIVEGLAQIEKSLRMLRLMKKFLGLPEEASYTDEKSKERLEKLSLHFKELDALFVALETVKKEFLEL